MELMGIILIGCYIKKFINKNVDNIDLNKKQKLVNYDQHNHEEIIPIKDNMEWISNIFHLYIIYCFSMYQLNKVIMLAIKS